MGESGRRLTLTTLYKLGTLLIYIPGSICVITNVTQNLYLKKLNSEIWPRLLIWAAQGSVISYMKSGHVDQRGTDLPRSLAELSFKSTFSDSEACVLFATGISWRCYRNEKQFIYLPTYGEGSFHVFFWKHGVLFSKATTS